MNTNYNEATTKYYDVVDGYVVKLIWSSHKKNRVKFTFWFDYIDNFMKMNTKTSDNDSDTTQNWGWNYTAEYYDSTSEYEQQYLRELNDTTKVRVYRGVQSFDSVWTTIKSGTWRW